MKVLKGEFLGKSIRGRVVSEKEDHYEVERVGTRGDLEIKNVKKENVESVSEVSFDEFKSSLNNLKSAMESAQTEMLALQDAGVNMGSEISEQFQQIESLILEIGYKTKRLDR